MPLSRQFLYCLGTTGYLITGRVAVAVALYFYVPPPGRGLEPQVSEAVFFGVFTVFGLAMLLGRTFDAFADPVVGHLSDRATSRLGRRRAFLCYGIVPMTGLPVVLFWPPGEAGSSVNAWMLGGVLSLYFVAFTVYVAPYLALLPELAPGDDARVRLTTLLALVSLPLFGLYNVAWPAGIELGRDLGLSSTDAVRAVAVASSVLALLLCALPILAVDEGRFTRSRPSTLSLGAALRATLSNRAFQVFLGAQLLFVFGVNLVAPTSIYYATVLLGRSESYAAWLGVPLLATAGLGFWGIRVLSLRVGPRRTMIACLLLTVPALLCLGLLVPDVPGGEQDPRNLALVWTSVSVLGVSTAGFLVLPHVLLGQVIDTDSAATGAGRAAMYYGVQGLLTKWAYGLSSLVLAYLFLEFGRSAEEPAGILLAGPVAAVATLGAAILYGLFPDGSRQRT